MPRLRLGRHRSLFAALPLAALALPGRAQAPLFRDVRGMLPADVEHTRALSVGDVDGDGDLDQLAGSGSFFEAMPNRLFLNDGTGIFTDASDRLPAHVDKSFAVALGDVDGDGDLDALIGNWGLDRLYLNDGGGTFVDASFMLPPDPGFTKALALGDLDGDEDLDLLLGQWLFEKNRLFLNDGTGQFLDASSNLPDDADPTRGVTLGDVDGDLDLDILVANGFDQSSPPDRLYLNDGRGFFSSAPAQLPVDGLDTEAIALGDVDGDGDLDALLANGQVDHAGEAGAALPNRLYLNDGAGTFSVAVGQLPPDVDDTVAAAFADIDGDGDLDLVLGNAWGSLDLSEPPDRLYLNDGFGNFSATSGMLAADGATLAVALFDADADLDIDLVLARGLDRQDRLLLNDGAGVFHDVTHPFPFDHDETNEVLLGDLDGDGMLDLFMANWVDRDRLYLNDGTGPYLDASERMPDDSFFSTSAALGDVDADADLDVLIGNFWSQPNQLLLNDGQAFFTDASDQLPPNTDSTSGVTLGDVDGDTDLDAYIANSASDPDRLWLNDGAGEFTESPSLQSITGQVVDAALGDMDADADLDLVVGDWGASNRRYINAGGGIFLDAPQLLEGPPDDTWDVELFDADGDLDLDLYVANSSENQPTVKDRLYLNDGTGNLSLTLGLLDAAPDFSRDAAIGDVDEDGDPDVLVGNVGALSSKGEANQLYLNDGTGAFLQATEPFPELPDATLSVAVGDVDGDGDVDAVVGNYFDHQNRIYFNRTRQLARRGTPRLGQPLTLDVSGPPGGIWILGLAFGKTAIPLPEGTLFLDPASLIILTAGVLDAEGSHDLTFAVPSDRSLEDFVVFWQAVVGPPFLLTNLEITRLTSL